MCYILKRLVSNPIHMPKIHSEFSVGCLRGIATPDPWNASICNHYLAGKETNRNHKQLISKYHPNHHTPIIYLQCNLHRSSELFPDTFLGLFKLKFCKHLFLKITNKNQILPLYGIIWLHSNQHATLSSDPCRDISGFCSGMKRIYLDYQKSICFIWV